LYIASVSICKAATIIRAVAESVAGIQDIEDKMSKPEATIKS
jgi:hypothetical protein